MTIDDITTPAYIIDENMLVHNLEILKYVEDKTGCKILLAQKAWGSRGRGFKSRRPDRLAPEFRHF